MYKWIDHKKSQIDLIIVAPQFFIKNKMGDKYDFGDVLLQLKYDGIMCLVNHMEQNKIRRI